MGTARVDLAIRHWHPGDEAAVLDLMSRSLGPGPAGERSAAFFRWKHLDNPVGRSLMLVAEDETGIVGLRALMRWRFRLGGRTLRAVRAVDTATDPRRQGQGIFSRLTTAALEELRGDADLVFNTPNGNSLPGYLKLGWAPVGRLPVHVRVRRPLALVRDVRHLGVTDTPRRARPAVRADPVGAVVTELDLAPLLATDAPEHRLVTDRSPEFFQWRYGDAPHLDYRAVGDADTGIAVFRVRPRGRLWETTIAEVLPRPDRPGATGRLLRQVQRAAATDHVTLHATRGTSLRRWAPASGFVRSPRGLLLVRRPVDAPLPSEVDDVRNWMLSLGDLEVF